MVWRFIYIWPAATTSPDYVQADNQWDEQKKKYINNHPTDLNMTLCDLHSSHKSVQDVHDLVSIPRGASQTEIVGGEKRQEDLSDCQLQMV